LEACGLPGKVRQIRSARHPTLGRRLCCERAARLGKARLARAGCWGKSAHSRAQHHSVSLGANSRYSLPNEPQSTHRPQFPTSPHLFLPFTSAKPSKSLKKSDFHFRSGTLESLSNFYELLRRRACIPVAQRWWAGSTALLARWPPQHSAKLWSPRPSRSDSPAPSATAKKTACYCSPFAEFALLGRSLSPLTLVF
jgi:hypothetical protein